MGIECLISVEIVFSPQPRLVRRVNMQLQAGVTVAAAVRESRILDGLSVQEVDGLTLGIWGRKTTPGHTLRDRDRIEIYRALRVDPKVARRERFARQGARTSGLFLKRRVGAKDGY